MARKSQFDVRPFTDIHLRQEQSVHLGDGEQSLIQLRHQCRLECLVHVGVLVDGPEDLDLDLGNVEFLLEVRKELDGRRDPGRAGRLGVGDGEGEVLETSVEREVDSRERERWWYQSVGVERPREMQEVQLTRGIERGSPGRSRQHRSARYGRGTAREALIAPG